MRILFLNANIPNYVTDGLFHGLRSISGVTVVDIPRADYMYVDATKGDLDKTGSKGNTLYQLLVDPSATRGVRTFWQLSLDEYDYIIFSEILYQCDLFNYIYKTIHPGKRNRLVIVDGYDMTAMYPFFLSKVNLKVRPWVYMYNFRKVGYYKREYENSGELYGILKRKHPLVNKMFSKLVNRPSKLFQISMSIPEENIETIRFCDKSKDFVNYNIDNDLIDLFPNNTLSPLGKWQPTFTNQDDYYEDIKQSKFGITAKRAGWDCLRHYEYAAKGAILCFKNLKEKSVFSAPFGLNEANCITYTDKADLLNKLRNKSVGEFEAVQENQYTWINNYTTKKVAQRFMDQLTSKGQFL